MEPALPATAAGRCRAAAGGALQAEARHQQGLEAAGPGRAVDTRPRRSLWPERRGGESGGGRNRKDPGGPKVRGPGAQGGSRVRCPRKTGPRLLHAAACSSPRTVPARDLGHSPVPQGGQGHLGALQRCRTRPLILGGLSRRGALLTGHAWNSTGSAAHTRSHPAAGRRSCWPTRCPSECGPHGWSCRSSGVGGPGLSPETTARGWLVCSAGSSCCTARPPSLVAAAQVAAPHVLWFGGTGGTCVYE